MLVEIFVGCFEGKQTLMHFLLLRQFWDLSRSTNIRSRRVQSVLVFIVLELIYWVCVGGFLKFENCALFVSYRMRVLWHSANTLSKYLEMPLMLQKRCQLSQKRSNWWSTDRNLHSQNRPTHQLHKIRDRTRQLFGLRVRISLNWREWS